MSLKLILEEKLHFNANKILVLGGKIIFLILRKANTFGQFEWNLCSDSTRNFISRTFE